MDTNQINKLVNINLEQIKCFLGVFPRDKLPKTNKQHFALIVNTDKSDKPGQHWLAITCKNGKGYYFDSFGLTPIEPEIKSFLKRNCPQGFVYNKNQIQHWQTKFCGLYASLMVIAMCKGIKFKTFLNLFTKNQLLNDKCLTFLLYKVYKGK